MHASSGKTSSAAQRGVSERVVAINRQKSFTTEDCDVFHSELNDFHIYLEFAVEFHCLLSSLVMVSLEFKQESHAIAKMTARCAL